MDDQTFLKELLSDRTFTIHELVAFNEARIRIFRRGAMGDHDAYNLARDISPRFEEDAWINAKKLSKLITRLRELKANPECMCDNDETALCSVGDDGKVYVDVDYLLEALAVWSRFSQAKQRL